MAAYTPGAQKVATEYNFVSSFNVHKPDIGENLTERYGSELITGLLDLVGNKKAVSGGMEFKHFEAQRKMPKIKATNGGAGAPGAAVTFTLDASATTSYGFNQSPYDTSDTTTQNGIPVRLNDLIMIKPGTGTVSMGSYIRAIVTTVTPASSTFAATPIDSTEAIPSIASADEIVIYSNAHAEGSTQPESMDTTTIEYTNNTQIIKETYNITGSERAMKLWFKTKGPDGKVGYTWTYKGERDAYHRFLNYRELTLMVGEKLSNTTLSESYSATGGSNKTTEGLFPNIISNGNTVNYSQITGMTIADIESMTKTLDKQKGSMENLMCNGIALDLQLDRELGDRLKNGAISYGSFAWDADKSVNFRFRTFQMGSYVFHKKTFNVFNDLQTFGADGYGFEHEGVVIPMDSGTDAKSGEKIPSIRLRYLQEDNGESREMKVAPIDLFRASSGADKYEVRYLSECGLEVFAPNRFVYVKRA